MTEKRTLLFFEREGVATRSSTGGVFNGACGKKNKETRLKIRYMTRKEGVNSAFDAQTIHSTEHKTHEPRVTNQGSILFYHAVHPSGSVGQINLQH